MSQVKQVGPGRYGYTDPRPRTRGAPLPQEIAALVQSYNEEAEVPESDEPDTAAETVAAIGRNPRKVRSGEYDRAAFYDAIRTSKQAPK